MAVSTTKASQAKPFTWEVLGKRSTDRYQGKGNPIERWRREQAGNDAAYAANVARITGTEQTETKPPVFKNSLLSWNNPNTFPQRPAYDEGPMTFEEFMAMQGNAGAGPGDGGAAARQQMVDAITQSFDRQIAGLNTNRTNAANLIQQFANQFKTNLQPISQQFQGATQASVGEIARRAAEGQAQASNLAKELTGSLTGLGVNAQPIQQQAAMNAQQAAQGAQYEKDFTARLAQIAAMNEANALSGNELVRQGAAGSLEQNYAQMLTALQNAKEQEILGAQTASSGGGGGGGGYSDPLDQMTKYFKTKQLFDEVMGGGVDYTDIQSLMSAGAKKDPNAYLAALLNMTPEQRQSFGIEG